MYVCTLDQSIVIKSMIMYTIQFIKNGNPILSLFIARSIVQFKTLIKLYVLILQENNYSFNSFSSE